MMRIFTNQILENTTLCEDPNLDTFISKKKTKRITGFTDRYDKYLKNTLFLGIKKILLDNSLRCYKKR